MKLNVSELKNSYPHLYTAGMTEIDSETETCLPPKILGTSELTTENKKPQLAIHLINEIDITAGDELIIVGKKSGLKTSPLTLINENCKPNQIIMNWYNYWLIQYREHYQKFDKRVLQRMKLEIPQEISFYEVIDENKKTFLILPFCIYGKKI